MEVGYLAALCLLPVTSSLEPVLLPSCSQHQPPAADSSLSPCCHRHWDAGKGKRGAMNNSDDKGSLSVGCPELAEHSSGSVAFVLSVPLRDLSACSEATHWKRAACILLRLLFQPGCTGSPALRGRAVSATFPELCQLDRGVSYFD